MWIWDNSRNSNEAEWEDHSCDDTDKTLRVLLKPWRAVADESNCAGEAKETACRYGRHEYFVGPHVSLHHAGTGDQLNSFGRRVGRQIRYSNEGGNRSRHDGQC